MTIECQHEMLARACELCRLETRIMELECKGHRLALELECLLMDTKDLPVVSKWWDSGLTAVSDWQDSFEYNGPRLGE